MWRRLKDRNKAPANVHPPLPPTSPTHPPAPVSSKKKGKEAGVRDGGADDLGRVVDGQAQEHADLLRRAEQGMRHVRIPIGFGDTLEVHEGEYETTPQVILRKPYTQVMPRGGGGGGGSSGGGGMCVCCLCAAAVEVGVGATICSVRAVKCDCKHTC